MQFIHLKKCIIGVGALVIVIAGIYAFPRKTSAQTVDSQVPGYNNWRTRLGSLNKMSDKERESILIDASDDRDQLESSLLVQLNSPDKEIKCYAAFLLGFYRCEKAVPALSQQISLEDPTVRLHGLWFWSHYPAADALARIGQRSIPAMFSNIETSDDPKVQKLSRDVIRVIADDPEIVHILFKRQIDKQQDEKKKEKLQTALQALYPDSVK
jgi:hypothetical protein